MGIASTQGLEFKLVANDEILDLFKDEQILLSDNVTGLFDLGVIPADFTRQLTLPGTKKNNAFFEHYYDISIVSPEIFATNKKVPCYLDFGGFYLAQGYLQLNQVNVIANKFIDSWEVSIYGSVSSFAREVSRNFLTDMTASLSQFNHTASFETITGSWEGRLFSGSIVYPFAEYGQKIIYPSTTNVNGIDSVSGSLFVQDYKPSIRIKEVWDAIFNQYGYTYSGSFWEQPFLDNIYMVCNNQLRYPIFEEENLETYGQFRIGPTSGSTDIIMSNNVEAFLPYYTIFSNPGDNMSSNLAYTIEYPTKLRGTIELNLEVSQSGAGNGVPQFELVLRSGGPFSPGWDIGFLQGTDLTEIPLTPINSYFRDVREGYVSQGLNTATQKYTLAAEWNTPYLLAGTYRFYLKYKSEGGSNFIVKLDPDGSLKSSLAVTKLGNLGEGWGVNIGANMPFGTRGIKQIDFITAIQKKFNLVMYPSKTQRNEFIVETFNQWYNKGQVWDFNKYINLDKKLEVIPANNLAVNELNFGDTLDQDYISQQFSKLANREYGKTYYVDTENFFSQGNFEVKTSFASSPIIYLQGTGISGSQNLASNLQVSVDQYQSNFRNEFCGFQLYPVIDYTIEAQLLDANGNPTVNFGSDISIFVTQQFNACFGGTFPTNQIVTIPYGSSVGTLTYVQSRYVDCGFFPNCSEEYIDTSTACITQIFGGGNNVTLFPGSPIQLC
jgi:hypothetical protein